jgi:hypothetical protein
MDHESTFDPLKEGRSSYSGEFQVWICVIRESGRVDPSLEGVHIDSLCDLLKLFVSVRIEYQQRDFPRYANRLLRRSDLYQSPYLCTGGTVRHKEGVWLSYSHMTSSEGV